VFDFCGVHWQRRVIEASQELRLCDEPSIQFVEISKEFFGSNSFFGAEGPALIDDSQEHIIAGSKLNYTPHTA
jgi:hypothetical protein